MRWRRKPTAAQLERWLASGEPDWVERWLDDPEVTTQLERLSALPRESVSALQAAVTPSAGFAQRTFDGVSTRVGDLQRMGVLFGLLGLGPRIAGALIDPDEDRDVRADEDSPGFPRDFG